MTKDTKHLSAFKSFKIPLLRILFISVPHFKFGYLVCWCLEFFIYLDISPLLDVILVKVLSQSVSCSFVLLLSLQKLFSFIRSHLLIIDHNIWAGDVLFRKLSPIPIYSRLFPTFPFIIFSVSSFMLRSLIHLDLSFVQCDKYGCICICLHAGIELYQHYLLKMLFFSLYDFGFLSKFKCPLVLFIYFTSLIVFFCISLWDLFISSLKVFIIFIWLYLRPPSYALPVLGYLGLAVLG